MLRFTQHRIGLVNSAGVGVVILLADPAVFVVEAGGRLGPHVIDEGQLRDGLSVIHVRDDGDVVGGDVQIAVAGGQDRERDSAPRIDHVGHLRVGVESAVALIHIERAVALLPGILVPVPVGALGGGSGVVGPDFLGLGQSGLDALVVHGGSQLAVDHGEHGAAVGHDSHHVEVVAGADQAVHVVDAVVVGVAGEVSDQGLEVVPGPGAVSLHVIDGVVVDAGVSQNLLVEEQHLTGLGVAGVHAVDLAVLGHALAGRGIPLLVVEVDQIVVPGSEVALLEVGADRAGLDDPQSQGSVGRGDEVVELSDLGAPVALLHLDDVAVVGLFQPVAISVLSGLLLVGVLDTGAVAGPVVVDVDGLTVEVNAFDHVRILGQGRNQNRRHHRSKQKQGNQFLHDGFLLFIFYTPLNTGPEAVGRFGFVAGSPRESTSILLL